jgi:alkylation response protein AidB-like acyl-CoA dehydrogenase
MLKVLMAKHFASRAASKHAPNAVQVMGAIGCSEPVSVARYYRDSKILEIIEGSTQVIQMILGMEFARKARLGDCESR